MKMKVSGHLVNTWIDYRAFNKTLLAAIERQNRQAIRAWLRQAILHIPSYTATARGTFAPLGRVIRAAVPKAGPLHGRTGDQKNAKKKKYIYYGGRKFKTGFSAGGQYSGYNIDTEVANFKITASFEFMQNLPYVVFNNANPPPPGFQLVVPGPWHYKEQAAKAWYTYLVREARSKLPKTFKGHIRIIKVQV